MTAIARSFFAIAACAALFATLGAGSGSDPLVARGKYLVAFSCNDCHTPGWRDSDGGLPVSQWMTGSKIGYRGPWGTSYATNVRREFQRISEDQWLFMVRTRGGHWPMVWHDLRELSISDRRAIYRFVHSLGARGADTPNSVPPWKEPSTPYMWVYPSTPNPNATPRR